MRGLLPLSSRITPASASPAELALASSGVSPPEETPELKGRWGVWLQALLEAVFPEKVGLSKGGKTDFGELTAAIFCGGNYLPE